MGVLSWVSERGENVNTAPKVQVTETSTCVMEKKGPYQTERLV